MTLISPLKISLDQFMVLHKVHKWQWQTLRLSTHVDVYNHNRHSSLPLRYTINDCFIQHKVNAKLLIAYNNIYIV